MRLFTTKVELIEAVQWDGARETYQSLVAALGDLISRNGDETLSVVAPDGVRIAELGDWVVREPSGHCFAMDPAVFQNKYAVLPQSSFASQSVLSGRLAVFS